MGKYSVIAEVSQKLADILTDQLVSDILPDSNSIGFCTPQEQGDYTLGIHLYNIERNADLAYSGMVNRGLRQQRFPAQVLSLYYMITPYSKSDLRFRQIEEQKVLGGVLQALADHNIIAGSAFGNDTLGQDARIELLEMDMEEKIKIWGDTTKLYKPSVFCKITPVELDSLKTKTVARVREFAISLDESTEG